MSAILVKEQLDLAAYLRGYYVLVDKVFRQDLHDLHLLLGGESSDSSLNDAANGSVVNGNEARVVKESD